MDFQSYKINDLSKDELLVLLGVNDNNLKILRTLYKTDINYRNNEFMFFSDDISLFNLFKKHLNQLVLLIMNNKDIDENIINQSYIDISSENDISWQNDIAGYNNSNKPILYKNNKQRNFIKIIDNNDLIFSIGPAGTGKTFLSVLYACNSFKQNKINKIILSRPAVEAGESLGFLPGDLKEKVDPYLMPLYDSLYDILGEEKVNLMIEKKQIEIIPLAYMRGRTLNDSIVILDEAQNTTKSQMLMFLTRLGKNSKMIINGDLTQVDINISKNMSGLAIACDKLKDLDNIYIFEFNKTDIIRNPLVKKVIENFN